MHDPLVWLWHPLWPADDRGSASSAARRESWRWERCPRHGVPPFEADHDRLVCRAFAHTFADEIGGLKLCSSDNTLRARGRPLDLPPSSMPLRPSDAHPAPSAPPVRARTFPTLHLLLSVAAILAAYVFASALQPSRTSRLHSGLRSILPRTLPTSFRSRLPTMTSSTLTKTPVLFISHGVRLASRSRIGRALC